MVNKVFKSVVLILMIVGIFLGVSITIKKEIPEREKRELEAKILNMIQEKSADVTSFYTYGRAFNINGKISNIKKDNFEGAKLVITDGVDYENVYNVNYSFEENNLIFSSREF